MTPRGRRRYIAICCGMVTERKCLFAATGFIVLCVVLSSTMITIACTGTDAVVTQTIEPQKSGAKTAMYDRLAGKWVRPDGGYILVLRNVGRDGDVKAAYYNPKPINVANSFWKGSDGGMLTVFVELRDINYQGSTYTLHYDRERDRLRGTYFQAPTGQTYDIEFVRIRKSEEQ